MADVNLASSSDVINETREPIQTSTETYEPILKKQRKDEGFVEKGKVTVDERLETRLGGILCCSVCLDLPSSAVYQVTVIALHFSIFMKHGQVRRKFYNSFFGTV